MKSAQKRLLKGAGRSRMKCCLGSTLYCRESLVTCDPSEALILSAEIQDSAVPAFRFEGVSRQDSAEEDLMIASGIDFHGFAFEVPKGVLQERLTCRTLKI